MMIYCTKYALSSGITSHKLVKECGDGCVEVEWPGGFNGTNLLWRTDWHPTVEGALARAEAMRLAKIVSLEKQKAKLEKMKFGVKVEE